MNAESAHLIISSPAFEHMGSIPARYTCDGIEVSPPLHIANIPEDAKTLAIIAEDPDAPNGTFDHWLVWNIPVTDKIAEGTIPGVSGSNSSGRTGYHGPCPPSGTHRYFFYVYALNRALDIPAGADKNTLLAAIEPATISRGVLMAKFQKMGKTI